MFSGAGSSAPPPPRETDRTAELDNRQLLSLQQQIIRQQDEELMEVEKMVQSTKVRAWRVCSSGVGVGGG